LIYLLAGSLAFFITLVILVRNPFAQTLLARIATSYLSRELGTEVKVHKLEIRSFHKIDLYGLLAKDQHADTLLSIRKIKLRLKGLNHLRGNIILQSLTVEQADLRITKYEGQEQSNLGLILNQFSSEDTVATVVVAKDFILNEITLTDTRFRYNNMNEPIDTTIIDFEHPEVTNLFIQAKNLRISGDTVSADIEFLSLTEKTGFRVDTLSCNFRMEPTSLIAENLILKTHDNDLDLDLKFSFDQFNHFNDFLNLIEVSAMFRPSMVNLVEVRYFAPVMETMDNSIRLSGNIRGTVNDFKARDFEFSFGQSTQFKGNIQMQGLPDVTETFCHLSIENLVTTANDIRGFRLPLEGGELPIPELLDKLGRISIKGKFTGFYNDFVSYAHFNTAMGNAKTDLLLRMDPTNTIEYKGSLTTTNFNAGKLFSAEEDLGRIDLSANVQGSGVSFEKMQLSMEGKVGLFEFRNIAYRDILINGDLTNKKFTGMLDVNDDLIQLSFNGVIDYSQNIPLFNFKALVRDAWLDKINLISRDSSSVLSTNISINFMGDQIDNMQGIIILDSTRYEEMGKQIFVKDITLSITRDLNEFSILRLYSDFLDATIEGRFRLMELPDDVSWLLGHHLETLFSIPASGSTGSLVQDFTFSLELKNTRPLSELFVPNLSIAPKTNISGGFNSRTKNLYFDGQSSDIDYGGISLKNWYCGFAVSDEFVQFTTGTETIVFSDTLKTISPKLILTGNENVLDYHFAWNDSENQSFTHGNLDGQVSFIGKTRYQFKLDQAEIFFADTLWTVSPDNFIVIDTNYLWVNNFTLSSESQQIQVHGIITPNPLDTLSIGLTHFNLSNFDLFLNNMGVNLDGIIDGNIRIIDYFNSPFYLADLNLFNFYFNGEGLGDARILTSWDPITEAFDIMADFIYKGSIGTRKIVGVNGRYFPNREEENFDILIELDRFKLNAIEPFVRSFSSEIDGWATGKINMTGTQSLPQFNGEVDLARASLLIDYLNVKYFFADKIKFDNNRFYFNNMTLYDSLNNEGLCTGEFKFGNLKDMELNLSVTTANLLGLNTTRRQNSLFYGKGLISGTVSINGPLDNLVMNIGLRTERGTSIKMPISYETAVGSSDYIIFVNTGIEEELKQTPTPYETNLGGMTLNLDMGITPDAEIQIFMPYEMGELKARGRGNLKMNIMPDGELTMNGEYVVERGSFFLTLQKIINRNFELRKGGTVTWRGDPYDAQINVKAVYKVKTTLGEYGPEQDSATRVSVDCIIALKNRLLDPEIQFTIEFPDLKEDTKQYIYANLDTTNQALMTQQMISLLVLNSFSQSTGYSGSVGFNTYSLITNQLNNWLSQISNDFDIGVNYRPGDDISAQEVELALSTQLWEDRITIDGNIGVRGNDNSQNTSNFIGEVNVEVKLTRDGRLRAKAFNKSNNELSYETYSPYTQGVGIFYTQDFNRFGDLFIRKKKKQPDETGNDDHVSR
jgi:hypothetical protein